MRPGPERTAAAAGVATVVAAAVPAGAAAAGAGMAVAGAAGIKEPKKCPGGRSSVQGTFLLSFGNINVEGHRQARSDRLASCAGQRTVEAPSEHAMSVTEKGRDR